MSGTRHVKVVLLCVAIVISCTSSKEHVPNNSEADNAGSCVRGGEGDCKLTESSVYSRDENQAETAKEWTPFRIQPGGEWHPFKSLVEKYMEWHKKALSDPDIPCSKRKVLIFEPNAGLGDSIGALTAGFVYSLRAGRLYFINWKPFAWSVTFQPLPFMYNYEDAMKLRHNKTGEPVICPDPHDASSFLKGHVTYNHPIVKEAEPYDFNTEYDQIVHFFINPSKKVQEVVESVTKRHFNENDNDVIQHKVALVMRTGIGEYNQFLSIGDEANFVTCFRNYARSFKEQQSEKWRHTDVESKKIKFLVLITSDNEEAKQNAIKSLNEDGDDLDLEVISLEDSIVHVMHMTSEESRQKRMRNKLRKTIAEFFLISLCDARFLTHGSLFGRAAAERAGDEEETNFFISDSNCDGKREKHSYLQCHKPKYPAVCKLK